MILAVYTGLNLEQVVRISDMCFEAFRHLIKALEQGRINLCKCLCNRIFIIHDIEVYIAIICVYNDLDRVSDIVYASFSIGLRIRVV